MVRVVIGPGALAQRGPLVQKGEEVVFCEVAVFTLWFFYSASVTKYALNMCWEGLTNVFRMVLGLGTDCVCVEVRWYLVMVEVEYMFALLVEDFGRPKIGRGERVVD